MSAETVAELLHIKLVPPGVARLVAVDPGQSVRAATMLMNQHGIGSVLVIEDGSLVGIFTERDVLRRVVAESRPPDRTTVGEVMTSDVICCQPETPLDDVADTMRLRRIRHVPVVEADGHVVGMVSIGDVNAHRFAVCETTLHQVEEYIFRRA
jgi:CBS domain-containing protein